MCTFGETSFCLYPIPTIALLSRAAGSRTAPRCCACIALDPPSPVLQVGFPLWPCLWGCPQHPAAGQWDGPAVRSCPAAQGVKPLALTSPLHSFMFPGSCCQWWVWPLVTASCYSEQKFLMGMMWMEQFSAQLLQFIQGDKTILKKAQEPCVFLLEPISCHITQPGHFLMGLEEVGACSIGIRSD